MKHKYRVITSDHGAFMVYAVSATAARRQIARRGYSVVDVRLYRYHPPTKS